jgi:hypothetical protein
MLIRGYWEVLFTQIGLWVAAVFYLCVIIVFLVADKTRLNMALALQKLCWLNVIALVTIPIYHGHDPLIGSEVRTAIWVLVEVYLMNRRPIARKLRRLRRWRR